MPVASNGSYTERRSRAYAEDSAGRAAEAGTEAYAWAPRTRCIHAPSGLRSGSARLSPRTPWQDGFSLGRTASLLAPSQVLTTRTEPVPGPAPRLRYTAISEQRAVVDVAARSATSAIDRRKNRVCRQEPPCPRRRINT
jgi:hypothetical protein